MIDLILKRIKELESRKGDSLVPFGCSFEEITLHAYKALVEEYESMINEKIQSKPENNNLNYPFM